MEDKKALGMIAAGVAICLFLAYQVFTWATQDDEPAPEPTPSAPSVTVAPDAPDTPDKTDAPDTMPGADGVLDDALLTEFFSAYEAASWRDVDARDWSRRAAVYASKEFAEELTVGTSQTSVGDEAWDATMVAPRGTSRAHDITVRRGKSVDAPEAGPVYFDVSYTVQVRYERPGQLDSHSHDGRPLDPPPANVWTDLYPQSFYVGVILEDGAWKVDSLNRRE